MRGRMQRLGLVRADWFPALAGHSRDADSGVAYRRSVLYFARVALVMW